MAVGSDGQCAENFFVVPLKRAQLGLIGASMKFQAIFMFKIHSFLPILQIMIESYEM